jgi:acyl-CoA synthetase (AMP-forming)/AMP-acid ligase II
MGTMDGETNEAWPVPWPTIDAMIESNVARLGASEAVVDGDMRLTFTDLHARAKEVAAAMHAAGIAPGDRVSVWAPNEWRWAVIACATWLSGGVMVPISTRFGAFEAGDILTRAGVKMLFVIDGFLGNDYIGMLRSQFGEGLGQWRPFAGLEALETMVVLGDRGASETTYEQFAATGAGKEPPSLDVDPGDTAEILFTSGTTGQPKGVRLDHHTLLRSFSVYGNLAGVQEGFRYLSVLPFGHGGGMNGCLLTSLVHGLTNVPLATFDAATMLDVVERERINVMVGPPAMYNSMLNAPELAEHDLSSLHVAMTGAASVAPKLIEDLQSLGVERVINVYGIIEACVISMTRADDPPEVIVNTAGRPVPDMQVQVVDEDGRALHRGEIGEILVRGVGLMRGYLDAEQTKAAIDAEGWFHSGDMGVLDEAGNVTIVDRRKDMFHVGGFNVYPAEVEAFLLRHPGVAAVAVVGQPNEKLGNVGLAFVVPRADASITVEEIEAWSRGRMANYKIPRRVELVDELPLNPTGKVDKIELRARAEAGTTEAGRAAR